MNIIDHLNLNIYLNLFGILIYNNIDYKHIINNSNINNNYAIFNDTIFNHLKLENIENDKNDNEKMPKIVTIKIEFLSRQ